MFQHIFKSIETGLSRVINFPLLSRQLKHLVKWKTCLVTQEKPLSGWSNTSILDGLTPSILPCSILVHNLDHKVRWGHNQPGPNLYDAFIDQINCFFYRHATVIVSVHHGEWEIGSVTKCSLVNLVKGSNVVYVEEWGTYLLVIASKKNVHRIWILKKK